MTNEIDKFFGDLPSEDKKVADVFEVPKDKPAEQAVVKEEGGEEGESHKNRRHRRLEEQLQRERESNIALNERIRTLAEVKAAEKDSGTLDPRLLRVFGDSDAGKQIAKDFGEILAEETERAKTKALDEFRNEQSQAYQEQKESEAFIDSQLESLEDEHNVDLTSNSPAARKARREFLEMVEKLSPKDEEGNISGYADFESTFDVYQQTLTKEQPTRQKEIASKSMQRSAPGTPNSAPTHTPGFRGWQTDYNIQN